MRPVVTVTGEVNKQGTVAGTGATTVKVFSLIRMIYAERQTQPQTGQRIPQEAGCWRQAVAHIGYSVLLYINDQVWSFGKTYLFKFALALSLMQQHHVK